MISIFIGILIFGVIIFVHELGHFLVARACGVGITEFALGMGPKIFSHKGKDDILYSLRLFPIGGYVSMIGEDEEAEPGMEEKSLCRKPVWKRFLVVSAGAFMNIALGFIVMGIIVIFQQNVPMAKINMFNVVNESQDRVENYQGLQKGDEILKVGNRKIKVWSDYVYEVMFLGEEETDLTVLRDGKKIVIPNFKFPTITEKGIIFGNPNFFYPEMLEKTPIMVVKETFGQSISTIDMIWKSLKALVTGKVGMQGISGPVGVIGEIKQTASMGVNAVMFLFVMLSMNVGVFNLLPIPALDGGRLFFLLIEFIRRKPINPKYEGMVHFAGLVILLSFMAFVTFNDIVGLIKK